ncbi:MAG: adenylate/guanylate cyclase domain-containing protein [Spirochaetota bacterium]
MQKVKKNVIEQLVLVALPRQAARSRLAAALRKRGIHSLEAVNGYMAVQLAAAKLPDCIVIAENIGIFSLAKIRRQLQSAPETAKIPLLILGKRGGKRRLTARPKGVQPLVLPAHTQTAVIVHRVAEMLTAAQAMPADAPADEPITGSWDKFIPAEFLALLGKRSVEETFHLINSYLSRMGPVIRQQGGFIDKYIGDGIMALFPGNPRQALDAAVHMQKELRVYNRHRARSGYEPLKIGIGIHHGQAVLGTIGENRRIEVTVISDAVNLASRLEGLCKRYSAATIVSEEALRLARPGKRFNTRYLDRVRVKGKQQPVGIFEVLDGLTPNLQKQRLHLLGAETNWDPIESMTE